jgi:hypothetical protein
MDTWNGLNYHTVSCKDLNGHFIARIYKTTGDWVCAPNKNTVAISYTAWLRGLFMNYRNNITFN